MFKNLSVVKALSLSCLLVFSSYGYTRTKPGASKASVAQEPSINTTNSGARPLTDDEFKFRSDYESCSESRKDFTTASSEFATACAKLPGSQSGLGKAGNIACSAIIRCCWDLDQDACDSLPNQGRLDGAIEKNQSMLDALNEAMSEVSSGSNQMSILESKQQKSKDLLGQQQLYNKCSMRASVDLDKAYEANEEARDKLEEREEAVSDTQQQLDDAIAQRDKDLTDIQEQMDELERNTKDQLKSITEQQEEAVQQLLEQIEAQQKEIRAMERSKNEIDMKKAEAYDALQQKITELNVSCYQEAVSKAQATRAKILEKAANNQYSAESMTSLYKSVGSSTLEDTQKLVEYHRNLCQKSYTYKESIKLAQNSYSAVIRSADNQVNIINEEIGLARIAISKLQSDDRNKIYQKAMEKIADLQNDYLKQLNLLNQKKMQIIQEASRNISRLSQLLAQKKSHLQAAQEYLDYKEKLLSVRTDATPTDDSVSSDDWGKVIAQYESMKASARNVLNCNGGNPCSDRSNHAAALFLRATANEYIESCQSVYDSADSSTEGVR